MQAKDSGSLISSLDVIAKDKKYISHILHPNGIPRDIQMKKIRALLSTEEAERYDAGMRLITALSNIEVPAPVGLDLADVKYLPKASTEAVKAWLVLNASRVRLYGSLVDWLYTKEHRPNDIDIAIDRPKITTEKLAGIIRETSDKEVIVEKYKKIPDSYKILVKDGEDWNIAVDTHPMSVYKQKMPYGWESNKPAVIVDGIPTEQLGEQLMKRGTQLLNPGVGIEGRGQIGPRAADRTWREKDIPRMEAVAKILIKEANRQGKSRLAAEANNDLRILMRSPVKPYPQVVPVEVKVKKRVTRVAKITASRAGGVR